MAGDGVVGESRLSKKMGTVVGKQCQWKVNATTSSEGHVAVAKVQVVQSGVCELQREEEDV